VQAWDNICVWRLYQTPDSTRCTPRRPAAATEPGVAQRGSGLVGHLARWPKYWLQA